MARNLFSEVNIKLSGYPRIFENIELKEKIKLSVESTHYLKNVLRLKKEEKFVLVGKTEIGLFRVTDINKKYIDAERIFYRIKNSNNKEIKVFQSILKREYMDFTIEKLAELGVTEITPVITERSLKSINSKTLERYNKLAIKGMLQSENEFFTKINSPVKLEDIELNNCHFIIFYEREKEKKLPEIHSNQISIFIGPEGGLTEKELEILQKKGGEIISPLNSILKAETAAVVFTGLVKCLTDIEYE